MANNVIQNVMVKSSRNFFNSRLINATVRFSSTGRIIQSRLASVIIPNVYPEDLITANFDKFYDKVAVECADTGRKYLFSQLIQKSQALTETLRNVPNLTPGDVVAIISYNIPEYLIIVLGAIRAGLTVTTVNPNLTAEEISKQFTNSTPKITFTVDEACTKVQRALNLANLPDTMIIGLKHQEQSLPLNVINFYELVSVSKKSSQQSVQRNLDDLVILPYSSGTTGLPKGVEITNKNLLSYLTILNAPECVLVRPTEGDHQDVIPTILPLFHIYGLSVSLRLLAYGCKLVMLPKFNSESFLQILKKHRPHVVYLVPPLALLAINNPKFHPCLEQIETIACGAAPLSGLDVNRLQELSKNKATVLQGYALTETTGTNHRQMKGIPGGIKTGGCGYVVCNTEFKIVSTSDGTTLLGPKEPGEICIKGPQVMRGYFKNKKATKEVIDEDGWFRTGDIGYFDEDEHLFVTDRIKELIKVKGFQVAPAELEAILRSHPDVADAAVVGISHEKFGEVPKAFVVLNKDKVFSEYRIQEYVSSKVVDYKRLVGGVVQLDAIPKTASGKILRKVLKQQ